jgi:hypothetical protein
VKEVSQFILSSLFRNIRSQYFAPTFLIDTNTMAATHQCGSCLKETIKGCAEADLPEGMVFAGSECGLRRPAHTWKEIGNCVTPF